MNAKTVIKKRFTGFFTKQPYQVLYNGDFYELEVYYAGKWRPLDDCDSVEHAQKKADGRELMISHGDTVMI